MSPTRPKKQHFNPQLHLRYFVGRSPVGMLWVYDFKNDRISPSLPEETAAQSNFYSIKAGPNQYNDSLDSQLQEIETKAAPIYADLVAGRIPIGQTRADFCTFIATLYVRTPGMLKLIGKTIAVEYQHSLKTAAIDPQRFGEDLRRHEDEHRPETRAALHEFAKNPQEHEMQIEHESTLKGMMPMADELRKVFFQMDWRLLDAGSQFFVSSDNPVTRSAAPSNRIFGIEGFVTKDVRVSLPLTPNRCLEMSWISDSRRVVPVNRETVRLHNRHRAYFADRCLYADRRDEGILRLGKKYGGKALDITVEGDDNFASVEVVRRFAS